MLKWVQIIVFATIMIAVGYVTCTFGRSQFDNALKYNVAVYKLNLYYFFNDLKNKNIKIFSTISHENQSMVVNDFRIDVIPLVNISSVMHDSNIDSLSTTIAIGANNSLVFQYAVNEFIMGNNFRAMKLLTLLNKINPDFTHLQDNGQYITVREFIDLLIKNDAKCLLKKDTSCIYNSDKDSVTITGPIEIFKLRQQMYIESSIEK